MKDKDLDLDLDLDMHRKLSCAKYKQREGFGDQRRVNIHSQRVERCMYWEQERVRNLHEKQFNPTPPGPHPRHPPRMSEGVNNPEGINAPYVTAARNQ